VWITTFYRLLSAKDVHHGKRCVNCKAKDITGLRYVIILINFRLSQMWRPKCNHLFLNKFFKVSMLKMY